MFLIFPMDRSVGLGSGYPDKVEAVNSFPVHPEQKTRSGHVGLVRLPPDERIKIKNPSLQKPKTWAPNNSKSFKARATRQPKFNYNAWATRHAPIDILRALRK
jgi:hypothetical protein